jgi:hypothetical protein
MQELTLRRLRDRNNAGTRGTPLDQHLGRLSSGGWAQPSATTTPALHEAFQSNRSTSLSPSSEGMCRNLVRPQNARDDSGGRSRRQRSPNPQCEQKTAWPFARPPAAVMLRDDKAGSCTLKLLRQQPVARQIVFGTDRRGLETPVVGRWSSRWHNRRPRHFLGRPALTSALWRLARR